jgi:nifR3 family TIM-barrel protein
MVSAKALSMNSKNTASMLVKHEGEGPLGAQLFGSDPSLMAEAAKWMESLGRFASIDINMGCPAKKIVSNGEGSALMNFPELAGKIALAVSSAVSLPVTAKIRKGFDSDNAVEIAKILEANGISAIAVHPRLRIQMYSGKADWSVIKGIKDAVGIPVVGNGDIFEPEDALRMFDETGCDGVMIGRGACGNPWIFKRIKGLLETGESLPTPTESERLSMALRHCRIASNENPNAIIALRSHLAWYTKGIPGSSHLRSELVHASTISDVERVFLKLTNA